MNIDEQLEQLAHLQCPRQVDVTDRVMEQVSQHPYLRRPDTEHGRRRVVPFAAAAAVTLLLAAGIALPWLRGHDSAVAEPVDHSWSTVEQAAVDSTVDPAAPQIRR